MDVLTIPFLGERRAGWQYPFGSLHAAGAALAAGSDWSVSSPNPLWAAHVAVNRSLPPGAGGGSGDPFLPGQALDLPTFLAAYTSGSARVNGSGQTTGAIRAGLDADFAVVDARSQSHPGRRDRHRGSHRDLDPWTTGLPAELRRRRSHGRTIEPADGLGGSGRVVPGRPGLRPVSVQHPGSGSGIVSPTRGLVATTPARTKPVQSVVWAVYRDVNSLDPIFAFDYPENTADSLMCESLLLQAPGGALRPGLATVSTPTPTTMVFTLPPGAKFWDGHPVTPADVVYSLDRNTDPKLGWPAQGVRRFRGR